MPKPARIPPQTPPPHNKGLRDFGGAEMRREPFCITAKRRSKVWANSYSGFQTQDTDLAERRRFVPIFCTKIDISFRDSSLAIFSAWHKVFTKSRVGSIQPLICFERSDSFSFLREIFCSISSCFFRL